MKIIRMFDKEYEIVLEPKYYPAYQRQMVIVIMKDGEQHMLPVSSKYEIIEKEVKE